MAEWDAKDKIFLITGAASGLGAQYAQAFLEQGAKNVAILDIAVDVGKATADRLNKVYGNKAVFIKCDVSKEEDITSAFNSVLEQFKKIDVIINNAGNMMDAPDMWRIATDVNWQGLVSFTLKGVKYMRKDEGGVGGTIINIASTATITKNAAVPIYCGSKAAVMHFSQCLAMEPFYENTGVRVLVIILGPTDTPILQNVEKRAYDPKLGKDLAEKIGSGEIFVQKSSSAVAAMLEMFKIGPPGSIWFSIGNKPVKNITPVIDGVFKDFEKLLLQDLDQYNIAQWNVIDKTFLITGAASGLGALYAEAFVEQGAKNVAILDIAEELGKATVERLNKVHGNKAVFIKCDVSKEEDITSAFDSVLEQFKKIDVIINNAGNMMDAPDMWRIATDVNWQGLVSFTLKGVKYMRKDEGGVGGTIINIASTASLTKHPSVPIYCGSKAAVMHFSQCLAMQPFYEKTGVRVLVMCLGPTDTPLMQNVEKRAYETKIGKAAVELIVSGEIFLQEPSSAVVAMLEMFRTGTPGSIWLAFDNKPVKNITPVVDRAFKDFEKLLLE